MCTCCNTLENMRKNAWVIINLSPPLCSSLRQIQSWIRQSRSLLSEPSLHLLIASPGLQAIQHRFSFPSSCSSPLIRAIHHLHQCLSTQDMSRPLPLPALYIFPPLPFITLSPCFYLRAKVSSTFFFSISTTQGSPIILLLFLTRGLCFRSIQNCAPSFGI